MISGAFRAGAGAGGGGTTFFGRIEVRLWDISLVACWTWRCGHGNEGLARIRSIATTGIGAEGAFFGIAGVTTAVRASSAAVVVTMAVGAAVGSATLSGRC